MFSFLDLCFYWLNRACDFKARELGQETSALPLAHLLSGAKYIKMAWKCLFCVGFSALYLSLLLTHMNSTHRDKDVNIKCGIAGCQRTFVKINTFVKHARMSHQQNLWSSETSIEHIPQLIVGKY